MEWSVWTYSNELVILLKKTKRRNVIFTSLIMDVLLNQTITNHVG